MPAANLLALIDDIATVLDDVAVLTKVATKKTAGVLGDDLALNAEQVTGVRAERELPVVWAVAKGSLVNKVILVPAALGISAIAPWAVTPLLMVGGGFLCYEGFEKLAHKLFESKGEHEAHKTAHLEKVADAEADLVAFERDKIKGAVRTDFVLSAEIVTIALGTVAAAPFATRLGVLVGISLVMTVGVYGLVAGIVKLDDLGLFLSARPEEAAAARLKRWLGVAILRVTPYLMKGLGIAGTAAMFLVGGGILTHGVAPIGHAIHAVEQRLHSVPGVGAVLGPLGPMLLNAVVGILFGACVFLGVKGASAAWGKLRRPKVH